MNMLMEHLDLRVGWLRTGGAGQLSPGRNLVILLSSKGFSKEGKSRATKPTLHVPLKGWLSALVVL